MEVGTTPLMTRYFEEVKVISLMAERICIKVKRPLFSG
jgi:hypothetical protein